MPDGDRPKTRTRISTKGQVILPKPVRDRHGWVAGTVLEIEDGPNGVTLKPARLFPPTRPEDVFGMLEYNGPPISVEDMHKAIEDEVLRRHARGRY
jgi:AbrB family looped-hinge helix DNA binding protein